MVRVKPFAAVRPPKNLVTEVAAPPDDVLNSEEAKEMAGEKSLLHITKPKSTSILSFQITTLRFTMRL